MRSSPEASAACARPASRMTRSRWPCSGENGLSPDVLDMVIAQTVKILMARTANSLPEAPFDPGPEDPPILWRKTGTQRRP